MGNATLPVEATAAVKFEDVVQLAEKLSFADQIRLMARLAPQMAEAVNENEIHLEPKPIPSIFGLWAEFGPAPTEEEIDQNRREMLGQVHP